jgi:outer membrane lipoprotein carrier protein
MKKIMTACAVALALIVNTANAQTDAKAKAILDAVSKKASTLKSLKANFTLRLSGGKTKETTKGNFLMKGQKYHVVLAKQELICDGQTVWTYMKDANEVQVSSYNPSEQSISPTKLFTNFYDKEFNYKYAGTRKVGGKDCDIIEMTPIKKGTQFNKVELAIDKASTIAGGNMYEKNGNMYQYEVSGYTPNAAVTDAQFVFNAKAHPGVEVVDLR